MSAPLNPHALNFNHETPAPWLCLLRLADTVTDCDHITDEYLAQIVAKDAGKPGTMWNVLQAARELLRAEGLRP